MRGFDARIAALSVLTLVASGCTLFSGNSRVLVTSEPAGAEILIDGEPTGLRTPSLIQLGSLFGADHVITVRKTGYEPEERDVTQFTTGSTSRWIDGATDEVPLITFPLFWTLSNLVLPFQVRWQYVPQEVYVRLHEVGSAPMKTAANDPLATGR